jgi:hypothetical protein
MFSSALLISVNLPFICVLVFLSFMPTFCFTNPDELVPHLLEISEGLLYEHCRIIATCDSSSSCNNERKIHYRHLLTKSLELFLEAQFVRQFPDRRNDLATDSTTERQGFHSRREQEIFYFSQ